MDKNSPQNGYEPWIMDCLKCNQIVIDLIRNKCEENDKKLSWNVYCYGEYTELKLVWCGQGENRSYTDNIKYCKESPQVHWGETCKEKAIIWPTNNWLVMTLTYNKFSTRTIWQYFLHKALTHIKSPIRTIQQYFLYKLTQKVFLFKLRLKVSVACGVVTRSILKIEAPRSAVNNNGTQDMIPYTPEKPDNSILSRQISSASDSHLIVSPQPANEEGYSITSPRSMLSMDMSKCDESDQRVRH